MAKAFTRLQGNAALRRRLGENACADARRRHSIEAVANAYQALYDQHRS
jgi:glycosyltransferase involved in cell wall biosynthesis